MEAPAEVQIGHLREEAARYRRLAKGPAPWHLAERLTEWADECDRQATRLVAGKWVVGKS